jgi:hypothetical protein
MNYYKVCRLTKLVMTYQAWRSLTNKLIIIALLSFFAFPAYSEPNKQAAERLTFQYKKGVCSLDNELWCPTHAEATEFGFTVHAVSTIGIRSLQIHYRNLKPVCWVWKLAGGAKNAQVLLRVVDEKNNVAGFFRNCQVNE